MAVADWLVTAEKAVMPELLFEVRSPGDRWGESLMKMSKSLRAGVTAVGVLAASTQTAHLDRFDEAVQSVRADEELTSPDMLGDFGAVVRRFFE